MVGGSVTGVVGGPVAGTVEGKTVAGTVVVAWLDEALWPCESCAVDSTTAITATHATIIATQPAMANLLRLIETLPFLVEWHT